MLLSLSLWVLLWLWRLLAWVSRQSDDIWFPLSIRPACWRRPHYYESPSQRNVCIRGCVYGLFTSSNVVGLTEMECTILNVLWTWQNIFHQKCNSAVFHTSLTLCFLIILQRPQPLKYSKTKAGLFYTALEPWVPKTYRTRALGGSREERTKSIVRLYG